MMKVAPYGDEAPWGHLPYCFNNEFSITELRSKNIMVNEMLSYHQSLTNEVVAWCEEQFGPGVLIHESFGARWLNVGGTFRFRDKADAAAFRIRWC